MTASSSGSPAPPRSQHTDVLSQLVRVFLESNLSIILIVIALAAGAAALFVTPREEDPQIVVPLADVFVNFPGHSAAEVEQLVTTPLEKILYQIDGVEYVYSMSRADQAIVTVRFYVGEDRERSLVKLFARLGEHGDRIAPGVTGWVMKPVEIDDVPVVTLSVVPTDPSTDPYLLRRTGEELVQRLSMMPQVSRAAVIGGSPRVVRVEPTPERMEAYGVDPAVVARALAMSNTLVPAGRFTRDDATVAVEGGYAVHSAAELAEIVVGVYDGRPVKLADVAEIIDGPDEVTDYVRHGWGPARGFAEHHGAPGTVIGGHLGDHADQEAEAAETTDADVSSSAVTIAISKQRGSNAVRVAEHVIERAEELAAEVLPDGMEVVVTRNAGLTADEKVNELIEALAVALVIVVALLTVAMGWREALVVAVAVPVVFGLTLTVNWLAGYTINRVTLFALILALGMLVDDPIVDVENIARHFDERKRASRGVVLDAVAEIRPPLISATLAVIVSFLPLFAITGMMGPYMSPMALGVPVAMAMSMLVAFTITPWLAYHVLGGRYRRVEDGHETAADDGDVPSEGLYDAKAVQQTLLYKIFRPLMLPLVQSRTVGLGFLLATALATVAAAGMGALRMVPLKMLPFDNKNEVLVLVDLDEGASLERTRAVVARLEEVIAAEPEVVDFTSHAGVAGPIDFNGLVRHYGLRSQSNLAELRVNVVGKKHRLLQSHGLGLRMRESLEAIGREEGALVRIVELPPGPPVLSGIVAEVRGGPDDTYDNLLKAGDLVADRLRVEPAVVEVDTSREAPEAKLVFVLDQEKAALSGVSAADVAAVLRTAQAGDNSQTLIVEGERNPLRVVVRLPEEMRSSAGDLLELPVRGREGAIVPLAEIGRFTQQRVDQTIHHKNLERVVYVTAETTSRPPAECVVDLMMDQDAEPRERAEGEATYLDAGSGIPWSVPEGISVTFAGEGEWKITLDVFRDLGIAFGAALVMIYVILVAQTGSFSVPMVVMLAIPLTLLGVMPGFWLLGVLAGGSVAGHADPVYFTATAMIGMIALAGIVTRDSIILVDFIDLAMKHGRPMLDAILESRVVRLRPILLTAGTAMLSAAPITLDPIFSGLGWSLIFGLVASTLFTLFVIPISYRLLRGSEA